VQDFIIDVQKKFQLGDHSESMREFEKDREAIAALLRGFGLLSAEDSNATRVRPADIAAVSAFRKRFRDRLSDAKRALELVHEAIVLGKQNHAQNPNGGLRLSLGRHLRQAAERQILLPVLRR
jgi:hypothetical protein